MPCNHPVRRPMYASNDRPWAQSQQPGAPPRRLRDPARSPTRRRARQRNNQPGLWLGLSAPTRSLLLLPPACAPAGETAIDRPDATRNETRRRATPAVPQFQTPSLRPFFPPWEWERAFLTPRETDSLCDRARTPIHSLAIPTGNRHFPFPPTRRPAHPTSMPCHPFLPIETSKSDPTHHQTRPIPIANYSYCYNHRSPPPPSAPAPSPIILPPRRASLHFDRLPSSSVHCHRQRVARRSTRLHSTPLDPTTVQVIALVTLLRVWFYPQSFSDFFLTFFWVLDVCVGFGSRVRAALLDSAYYYCLG